MHTDIADQLRAIAGVQVQTGVSLSQYTRFGFGGPAAVLAESDDEFAFCEMTNLLRRAQVPWMVLGGGTNLVVSDAGYPGLIVRFTGNRIEGEGRTVRAQSGAVLQDLVDFSISRGLAKLHTMTGIPGLVGGAVYGNAGAYGHSISESVVEVRVSAPEGTVSFSNRECGFAYRHSIFKQHKDWIVLSVRLSLVEGDRPALAGEAARIRAIRDEKYPPSMKCAGSIFKNVLVRELPEAVVAGVPATVIREGKIPSAWFLEQVGAKGMRHGGIEVAPYHANLIYNAGGGTAAEVVDLVSLLKRKVFERFGFEIEEEVQYVGFDSQN